MTGVFASPQPVSFGQTNTYSAVEASLSECIQQASDTVSNGVSLGASSEQAAKRQKFHHESGHLQAPKGQSATLPP